MKKAYKLFTPEEISVIKKSLVYDPDTGIVRRVLSVSKSAARHLGKCKTKASKGYLVTYVVGRKVRLHRLAFILMTGRNPSDQIDHINHDPSDNRWCNLREATNSQNCKNQKIRSTNNSGHPGVYFIQRKQKWSADITTDGKTMHLGYFSAKEDAIAARVSAEILQHGEFRRFTEYPLPAPPKVKP